jgi:hypothetical protein
LKWHVTFLIVITLIILVFLLSEGTAKRNYYETLNEAISHSNVAIDEIFHTTEYKGYTIIFYGKGDTLSAGLIEKSADRYRWGFGAGSEHFNVENQILTRSFSNLHTRENESDNGLVSLTFGVINDDSISKLMIKYKDQDYTEATIIETNKGRMWYCFSKTTVNYDPEVTRVYKDGTVISGWY